MDVAKPQGANRFGKYQLLRRLAASRSSEVFLAQAVDPARSGPVALKRMFQPLSENKALATALLAETKAAAPLRHRHIALIQDFGEVDDRFYVATELLDGISLERVGEALSKEGRRMPTALAARIMASVCDAVAYAGAHRGPSGRALVHQGLTPSRVMLTRDGGVKILDFGVASALAQQPRVGPAIGIGKGKFQYIAPEAAPGQAVDGRSDLFSLGVILYELTTGQTPFEGETAAEVAMAIRRAVPEAPAALAEGYPRLLSDVIMRALERDRDRRYRTAREMQEGLEAFLTGSGRPSGAQEIAAFASRFLGPLPRPPTPPPARAAPAARSGPSEVLRGEVPAGVFDDSDAPPTPSTVVARTPPPAPAPAAVDVELDVFDEPPRKPAPPPRNPAAPREEPRHTDEVRARKPPDPDEAEAREAKREARSTAMLAAVDSAEGTPKRKGRLDPNVRRVLALVFLAIALVFVYRAAQYIRSHVLARYSRKVRTGQ